VSFNFPTSVTQYSAPVSGQTVVVAANNAPFIAVVLEPAGLLAALTITFPVAAYDGQIVALSSTQVVTALTLNGGALLGALTAFAANTPAHYVWVASQNKWYRI
jgi:hypothetical protein